MALTTDLKKTHQARSRRDTAFPSAFLEEALETTLEGTRDRRGRPAQVFGFEELGRATGTPRESLMRLCFAEARIPTAAGTT
jgi:hypothetical protein